MTNSYFAFDFAELSRFAIELLKEASVWAAYWQDIANCATAYDVEELLLDYGYGQTFEY